jgi:hypothetical protein
MTRAGFEYVLEKHVKVASGNRRNAARLRTVAELYPEIVDTGAGEDPLPSCSAAEALERQEPFINQVLATSALAMLARLFRYGSQFAQRFRRSEFNPRYRSKSDLAICHRQSLLLS